MRAYDESYLIRQNALGEMLDYAVVDCGRDPDEFFDWFIVSGIAAQFERAIRSSCGGHVRRGNRPRGDIPRHRKPRRAPQLSPLTAARVLGRDGS